MPDKESNIQITNEIVHEMSGVKELRFNCPNSQEMTDAERILSRIKTFNFLLSYVASGRYMEVHLQQYGLKHNYFNSKWWKQFNYISSSAIVRYAKTSRYFIAASRFLSNPNDEELVKAGDPAALARLALIGQCSHLISAINASADHDFFKATFDHLSERVRKKQLPTYTQSPELVQEEWDIVKKVCEGVREIYEKDPSRDAESIVAQYVYAEFAHREEDEELETVPLMPLAQSDKAFLPISRAFQLQDEIGLAGSEGKKVRVSPKGDSEMVTIKAMISDKEGNPVSPTATHANLCAAIGQIWEENGCQPCTASVEKIYRVFAGLSYDDRVTPQQLAETEAAIDELMFMPAQIDFAEQIAKQKKIQRKDDIDYKKAQFKGAMIPAQKVKATYNGATVTAYKIYDMPLFYKYSHAVGQIAQVDRKLLSDMAATRKGRNEREDKKKKNRTEAEKSTGSVYSGTRVVNLRRYILTEIANMKRLAKKQKGKPLSEAARSISYENMAEKCGYDISSAQTIRTLRSNIDGYLAELVANKHIAGYKPTKDRQKLTGVCIAL